MRHRKTACFGALVFEPHVDQILRPLLATLLFPWLAEFAASIILFEDAKCEIAALSNTCGLHMILSQHHHHHHHLHHSFIHSFIHSFLPSFLPSFIHSFIHSFIIIIIIIHLHFIIIGNYWHYHES